MEQYKLITEVLKDPQVQKSITTQVGRRAFVKTFGFLGFLMVYLPHKFNKPLATFHPELIYELEHIKDFFGVIGFRGSAKSTLAEYYALYAFLEKKSKYTMYIGSTDDKSRAAIGNIKREIESNVLLQQDYKIPVEAKNNTSISTKWSETQIIFNDCTIQARSRGAKVRGVKFDDSRVTMVICDDLEDTENTKNAEIRKKTREWFFTELVPAMAIGEDGENSKIIIIGNLVHRDCLLAHLSMKENVAGYESILKVKQYPLIDDFGKITWKGMYPDMEAIENKKKKVMLSGDGMGNVIWAREYLLKMLDEDEQIIKDTDIQYYPVEWLQRPVIDSAVGVDLAISKKETADYTAMVKGYIVNNDYGERRLLVLPNPVKARLGFTETIQTAKNIKSELQGNPVFHVEDVAYQKAAIELMSKNGLTVVGTHPTTDKRARLISIAPYIKTGMVLFPKEGASAILEEILGFGIEPHDDCMDALIHLVSGMLDKPTVVIV